MAQWIMTAVLVAGCFAYALKAFLPKVAILANAADAQGSGCGGGCSACAHAASAQAAGAQPMKACASGQTAEQSLVFQASAGRKR